MIRRAALARALALDPLLLFLDEPTSGLDPIGAAAFDELLLYLQRELKLTVVMITHDLDSIFRTCSRVGVIVDGRMITDTLEGIVHNEHPWIKAYFRGEQCPSPRGDPWNATPTTSPSAGLCGGRLLVMGALFVYWYAAGSEHRDFVRYEIYFDGTVSGLSEGGPVRYLGVDVGRVYRIRIDPRAANRVQVIADIDATTPVNDRTIAQAFAAGCSGRALHRSAAGTRR